MYSMSGCISHKWEVHLLPWSVRIMGLGLTELLLWFEYCLFPSSLCIGSLVPRVAVLTNGAEMGPRTIRSMILDLSLSVFLSGDVIFSLTGTLSIAVYLLWCDAVERSSPALCWHRSYSLDSPEIRNNKTFFTSILPPAFCYKNENPSCMPTSSRLIMSK